MYYNVYINREPVIDLDLFYSKVNVGHQNTWRKLLRTEY